MSITDSLVKLQRLNVSIRAQLEQAEARIPAINVAIEQLSGIQLLPETALLGHVIFERHYCPIVGPTDTSQVLQAALLIPQGLGIVMWTLDEYITFRNAPNNHQGDITVRFVGFDDLEFAIKGLLMPHTQSLLDRVIQMATPPRQEHDADNPE